MLVSVLQGVLSFSVSDLYNRSLLSTKTHDKSNLQNRKLFRLGENAFNANQSVNVVIIN